MLTVSHYIHTCMPQGRILKDQTNVKRFYFYFFLSLLWMYGSHTESSPCLLTVMHSSSTRRQSKWRHNAGFSLKAPVLINKKCCSSMSAFLLLCVMSKCELAEGCQYVLQSHCWLCCSHTCREEPSQESASPIIHTATSNGHRALPASSPLSYCSIQLHFCAVVHLQKLGKG